MEGPRKEPNFILGPNMEVQNIKAQESKHDFLKKKVSTTFFRVIEVILSKL